MRKFFSAFFIRLGWALMLGGLRLRFPGVKVVLDLSDAGVSASERAIAPHPKWD